MSEQRNERMSAWMSRKNKTTYKCYFRRSGSDWSHDIRRRSSLQEDKVQEIYSSTGASACCWWQHVSHWVRYTLTGRHAAACHTVNPSTYWRQCSLNHSLQISGSFHLQCESKNFPPPPIFCDIFPKRLGIFSQNFTCLLNVPIYAGVQIFIQLPATLTKLCHNHMPYAITICHKRDHHNVLKMSTIDRNARWVVALDMA